MLTDPRPLREGRRARLARALGVTRVARVTGLDRTGVEVAKAMALGADLCGLAAPVIRAAMAGEEELSLCLETVIEQLRLAMFGIGAGNLSELRGTSRLVPASR